MHFSHPWLHDWFYVIITGLYSSCSGSSWSSESPSAWLRIIVAILHCRPAKIIQFKHLPKPGPTDCLFWLELAIQEAGFPSCIDQPQGDQRESHCNPMQPLGISIHGAQEPPNIPQSQRWLKLPEEWLSFLSPNRCGSIAGWRCPWPFLDTFSCQSVNRLNGRPNAELKAICWHWIILAIIWSASPPVQWWDTIRF